jgi:membrane fusion protein, multidrug efflux system
MSNTAVKFAPETAAPIQLREQPHAKPPVVAPPPSQDVTANAVVPAKKPPVRRIVLGSLVIIALAAAVTYGYDWWTLGRFQISTDDAYVKADMSVLGAKVSGYVMAVPFAENSPVKKGDVVLKLDDGDYQLAVKSAEAKIETQKAQILTVAEQKKAQLSAVASAEAELASATAIELNAVQTQKRASQLVKSQAGSQQALDDATRSRATAGASVSAAQAGIEAAKAQLAILSSQEDSARRQLDELAIALEKAERDLAFTEIKAPFDGIVANRAVEPGQFVNAGTRLLAVVPTQRSFVTANFKETQIASIHPGQKAVVTVDAFEGESFEGRVESLAPASGSEFSLLPPDNATGNFTKITQRLPVKIALSPELASRLRPGFSATVSVDSRDNGAP